MSSMLRSNPDLEFHDVELAIQGNLCRCTGYRPIVEGFRTLCKGGTESVRNDRALANGLQEVDTFNPDTFIPYTKDSDPTVPKGIMTDSGSVAFNTNDKVHWYRPSNLKELEEIRKKYKNVEYAAGGCGFYHKQTTTSNHEAIIQINHLAELTEVKKNKDTVSFGAAMTIRKMYQACVDIIKNNPNENTAAFKTLADVSRTWVNQQVRNTATIGGHIGWGHPCSDFIPIFMATGSLIEVLDNKGNRKIIPLNDKFWTGSFKSALNPGELILSLKIPFSKPGEECFYYRRGRRKEFDLAIANAAFFGSMSNDCKIKEAVMVVGGMEAPYPGAKSQPAKFANATARYINGKNADTIGKSELTEKVCDDVFVDDKAPGKSGNYRRCLTSVFVERFLCDIQKRKGQSAEWRMPLKSHQLFQKVDLDQPESDALERPIVHNWAAEQATGEARYIDDIARCQGELAVVPILSKIAHAVIKDIDFSKALKVPGIVGVLTPKDVPNNGFGLFAPDEQVLADEALYNGQMIAALVCKDLHSGYKARKLVNVNYNDERHATLDIHDIKNEEKCLLGPQAKLSRDQGVTPVGKVVTVKGTVYLGGQEHMYMEPAGALAIPSGEKDEMTIWAGTQNPAGFQASVSSVLGIPKHKIIVKSKRIGGAFGGKERLQAGLVAAVAAYKFNKPCRLVLSRRDDMASTGHRHNLEFDYQASADETGKIMSIKIVVNTNAGCSLDMTLFWSYCVLMRSDGGYTFKNFDGVCNNLRTNTVSNTAFRGFGGPEGGYAAEVMVEHLAHELKMDPDHLKEINLTREGDMVHFGDTPVQGCTLTECWNQMMEKSDYKNRKDEVKRFNETSKIIKKGISAVPIKFAVTLQAKMLHQSGAFVRIYTDGSVMLSHGGVEMGQGLHTKLLQVCSRALGVPIEKIHTHNTSTETVVNTTVTAGSTGSDFNGAAIIDACKQILNRLEPIKKQDPDGSWEDWIGMAYAEKINLSAFGFYGPENPIDYDFATQKGRSFTYFSYGAGCVEVEVNCHTGDMTVLSADLVIDLGRSLNPAIDIGQTEGAFIQALGYVTNEQLLISPKTGEFLNAGPSTYKIPTVADVPRSFNVTLLTHEAGRETSPCYTSKGVGEPPFMLGMGIPIAVRQAIASYR